MHLGGSRSLAAVAAAMVLGACHGEPMKRLRLGMNPWPGDAQLAVAVEAGLFAEHAVDPRIVEYASLHEQRRGFASGQIDVMPSTLVEVIELHAIGFVPEVVWVADTCTSRELPGEGIDTVGIDRRLLDADSTLPALFHAALAATVRYCTTASAAALRTMARSTGTSEAEFLAALTDFEVYQAEQQAAWLQRPQRLRELAGRILGSTRTNAPVPDFVLAVDRRSPLLHAAAPR